MFVKINRTKNKIKLKKKCSSFLNIDIHVFKALKGHGTAENYLN